MKERAEGKYGLREAGEAAKIVHELAQANNPNAQPSEYAAAILARVKSCVSDGNTTLALAVVDAAEIPDVSPALMWIGQKYAVEKNIDGLRNILDRKYLSHAHAVGLVEAYIHEFEGVRVGDLEYKRIEEIIGRGQFTEKDRVHLHDELEQVVDESHIDEGSA